MQDFWSLSVLLVVLCGVLFPISNLLNVRNNLTIKDVEDNVKQLI